MSDTAAGFEPSPEPQVPPAPSAAPAGDPATISPAAAGSDPATISPAVAGSGPAIAPRLELLSHVEMAVTVELGHTRMLLRDLLALRIGSIVELDRSAGAPVDVLVNGTVLAHGDVVVVDDDLGVRITEVLGSVDEAAG